MRCSKCGEAGEFFKGHAQCKRCMVTAAREYSKTDAGKEALRRGRLKYANSERGKRVREAYEQTEARRLSLNAAERRRKLKSPEKVRARQVLNDAVRTGRMLRKPCEQCGEVLTEAHHDDYGKPLDVRWLCRRHHAVVEALT